MPAPKKKPSGVRTSLRFDPPLHFFDRYALEDRCRALTNSVYLGDHTTLCRVLGYYKMYLDTNDTGFASHLMLDGFWEMWLTIFFARRIQPGMTVIDVGANMPVPREVAATLAARRRKIKPLRRMSGCSTAHAAPQKDAALQKLQSTQDFRYSINPALSCSHPE